MKKLLLIVTFLLTLAIQAELAHAQIFQDVNEGSQYSHAISQLKSQGIITGHPDGTYRPNDFLNRAEFLAILLRSQNFNTNIASSNCYIDVPTLSWYRPYICYATQKHIVEGYQDGTFRPANTISLAEALKIVLETFDISYPNSGLWYQGIIEVSIKKQLLPDTFSHYHQNVNRGQMADIIYRALNPNSITDSSEYDALKSSLQPFDPLSVQSDSLQPLKARVPIPFSSQAPQGAWIPPYDEACEETSLLMVEFYLRNKNLNPENARQEIVRLTKWVADQGYIIDISAEELAQVANKFYGLKTKVYTGHEVTIPNIEKLISQGYAVITPIAAQQLNNPKYTGAGPPYHMVVITAYDEKNFYINDPGSRLGENNSYSKQFFFNVIHDWNGSKKTVLTGQKAILVVN